MEFPAKARLVMQKVVHADAEFQDAVGDEACGSEKQKQLAAALKSAVDEFIDVASTLWPEFQAPDTAAPPTTTTTTTTTRSC